MWRIKCYRSKGEIAYILELSIIYAIMQLLAGKMYTLLSISHGDICIKCCLMLCPPSSYHGHRMLVVQRTIKYTKTEIKRSTSN